MHTGSGLSVWLPSDSVSCSSVCWPSGLSWRFLHTLLLALTPAVTMETQLAGTTCGLSGVLLMFTYSRKNLYLTTCTQHRFTVAETHMKQTRTTHAPTHISTCTLYSLSVLHFIYPSFPSLSFPSSPLMKPWARHTIKPLGLYCIVRRVHATPFSVVEALLACRDKKQPSTHTHTHTQRHRTCSFIPTGSLGFISAMAGVCRRNLTINQHIIHSGVTCQDNTLKTKKDSEWKRRGGLFSDGG